MDDRRAAIRELAAGQRGQFATRQALAAGLSHDGLRAWRGTGEIGTVARGVWCFTTANPVDRAVAAYLQCWPHGVISHRSAGLHHGLTRLSEPPHPEITVPRPCRRDPAGVRVHVTRALERQDVLEVGSVRYTSLARTVCDLAGDVDPWEALSLLDDAMALGASRRWIHRRATALSPGRAGVALLRDVTAPGAAGVFRSWLERAGARLFRAARIPDPEWNVPLRDAHGLIGVVDALWPPWRVVVEFEGLRFHAEPRQRHRDARRFNRLGEAGYVARRFGWGDVVHRPLEVAASVARALAAAGAGIDPARVPRNLAAPSALELVR